MLRKHQAEFKKIIDGILQGSSITKILCHVTPGGGKSALPVDAGRLIVAGLADAICWIVPRKSLQNQGEAVFQDPFFRNLYNHNLQIRASTNEVNPCRGLNGFTTTYQAIGVDTNGFVKEDFARRRYVLILDEYHHVEEGGLWNKALYALIQRAKYIILLSGTLERGNKTRIALTNYDAFGVPILESNDTTEIVQYPRTEALKEKAILPIRFKFLDGALSWENAEGSVREITSFQKATFKENSAALYTALHTEYANQLLTLAVNHWDNYRQTKNPYAKLLVVTDGRKNAERCHAMLIANGINARIATSHETVIAVKNIKAFKDGNLPVLVTIAMAYEGLDVPAISHIACLTHIRSTPWIEQMLARAVRINKLAGPYESQAAFVFAPKDKKFMKVVELIKSEQLAAADATGEKFDTKKEEFEVIPGIFDPDAGSRSDITPLSGEVINTTKGFIGNFTPQQAQVLAAPMMETPKDKELRLRSEISKHINSFCYKNRYHQGDINSEIKVKFGKPRATMTCIELERLKIHIEEVYPNKVIRGTGRRVSNKAEKYIPMFKGEGEWNGEGVF